MPRNNRPRRPIRIDGETAFITLSAGFVAMIDAADVHLVDGHNWSALKHPNRHTCYAMRRGSAAGEKFRNVQMHRILMGFPEGFQVDHIDGNGLNNRRSNLRLATHSENQRNSKTPKSNTSGIKGVSWAANVNKWKATISFDNKQKHLGFFSEKADAAKAYADAAQRIHGTFARLD